MQRVRCAAFGAAVLVAGAIAPDVARTQEPTDTPVAVPADTPLTVRITREDCLRLVPHRPAPDVAYQPGVDVDGDLVAPADLYGGVTIALPETVTIPIEVDLFDRFDLPPDQRYEGDVQVGTVVVDLDDGRATFNGQPLTPPQQRYLAQRCQEILRSPAAD